MPYWAQVLQLSKEGWGAPWDIAPEIGHSRAWWFGRWQVYREEWSFAKATSTPVPASDDDWERF